MSTENTSYEPREMFLKIATIFKEADEAEEMATRLKRIIRRDYEQLIDDIEKEEGKCETR